MVWQATNNFRSVLKEVTSMNLNDICELIVDCPHSTAPDEGEGFPLIRTPNIAKVVCCSMMFIVFQRSVR